MNEPRDRVKSHLCYKKIKFISLSHHEIFFLFYGQHLLASFNQTTVGNDVINILTSKDME